MVKKFWLESLKGRYHMEDLVIDWRIILIWILREIGYADVDWIHLAQDRNQWQALVNAITKVCFRKRRGTS
jgi:hypothetical protein